MERVRGKEGCSGCGEAISSDGLEQLPKEDLDKEPLCVEAFLEGGDSGGEGGEQLSGEARLMVITDRFVPSSH